MNFTMMDFLFSDFTVFFDLDGDYYYAYVHLRGHRFDGEGYSEREAIQSLCDQIASTYGLDHKTRNRMMHALYGNIEFSRYNSCVSILAGALLSLSMAMTLVVKIAYFVSRCSLMLHYYSPGYAMVCFLVAVVCFCFGFRTKSVKCTFRYETIPLAAVEYKQYSTRDRVDAHHQFRWMDGPHIRDLRPIEVCRGAINQLVQPVFAKYYFVTPLGEKVLLVCEQLLNKLFSFATADTAADVITGCDNINVPREIWRQVRADTINAYKCILYCQDNDFDHLTRYLGELSSEQDSYRKFLRMHHLRHAPFVRRVVHDVFMSWVVTLVALVAFVSMVTVLSMF